MAATQALARKYPELLIGIHLTDVGYPDQTTDFSTLSPAELEMAQWVQQWFMEEGIGVNMIMATKPQTLAYALNDSPIGLAAWLVSYASSGLKGKAEFKTRFPADEVLTNVMIYWVTQTIHTAARAYHANAHIAPTIRRYRANGLRVRSTWFTLPTFRVAVISWPGKSPSSTPPISRTSCVGYAHDQRCRPCTLCLWVNRVWLA